MRKLKLLFPALLAISLLSGCGDSGGGGGGGGTDTPKFTKYSLPEVAASSYYDGFSFSLKAKPMLNQIHKSHFEKHTKWVNYGSIAGYYKYSQKYLSTDAPNATSNLIEYFYTNSTDSSYSGTREHVWPCANSAGLWQRGTQDPEKDIDKSSYIGGGSDLFHVRPCDDTVNSARGNSKYVEKKDFANLTWKEISDTKRKNGTGTLWCTGLDSSGQFADKVEVADEYKGDVARLLVYMYTHYASIGVLDEKYQKYCGGLAFSQVLGYDEDTCKQKLCEWNELDPPSQTELLRNNTVQSIQGNRNMFVDYPALMPRIFGWY